MGNVLQQKNHHKTGRFPRNVQLDHYLNVACAFRSSNSIHDRVLFADTRVWLTGQSLKDAAKKKPTYIVEHDEPLMRTVYEGIWASATVI